MFREIDNFFDKLEDKIRISLSRRPITYALIGGVGIVLFWKGVWETAGMFPVLSGPVSVIIGTLLLLSTGLLVSFFVGEGIIISGVTREKKLAEKTEEEVRSEKSTIDYIATKVEKMEEELQQLEKETHTNAKRH